MTSDRPGAPPPGWHTVTPRIVARDARGLVDFIVQVFAGRGHYESAVPTIVEIGDSRLMVSDAGERVPHATFLYVYVADVEAAYGRALARGAATIEQPLDTPYGDRRCMVEDPWGNLWQIASRLA